ncbi:oxidoreductase, short-chain dehydrogenase/reductase family [Cordyceps fumosorosea ARSEF 2679]|uniref:Oxidoreductase, short-chain dehydrogenase/reductase family n=1 Tax=Cordyceps fumosorosea (strain ARSEF 2679) TaxID=1081104 RepID=A0A167LYC1_CORFA|nr:oxidoreductase, short-chain dehydrogenase/reductase family [Cordyceps fumosorosea ARSEF 2679]OAA53679.1 oxidoreductase, short-chain dehydrogenase/reductase family [Cordyceps fumosorosea ARSEF 2679]
MGFPYKTVLLVGATSGIGAGLADRLVQEGAKVIAVGRRQDRLDNFVQKHGAERSAAIKYDVTDINGLDAFVQRVVKEHPGLDCVFLNSGVQSMIRLSQPGNVDLGAFHREINTNFTSVVNLALKFSAVLLEKQEPTALIVTGTHLSIVPSVAMPAYSCSKAALHAFVDCLRRQNQGKSCRFIEINAPAVQTELHDYMGERGRSFGMPLADFVDQVYPQLERSEEHTSVGIPLGISEDDYKSFVGTRQRMFNQLSDVIMANMQL